MNPIFLRLDEVLAIHSDQITRYRGSPGIRDRGLWESALAMPAAAVGGVYLHGTVPEMAAAYVFHLAKNHLFVDGNKRVAATSAVVFLLLNGGNPTASEDAYGRLVFDVASGARDKSDATTFFKRHTQPARE